MRLRVIPTALCVVLLTSIAAHAAAQPAPTAPDLVRLRDGGLLRGTIAELSAGDHVTIVLLTGETRRIAAADFSFAGPADEAPRAGTTGTPLVATGATAVPPAPPEDSTPTPPDATRGAPSVSGARVRFRSPTGGRVIVDAAGETGAAPTFTRVCTTPCALVMPVGAYHIALTRSGLQRLTVDHLVPIEDRDRIDVDYETRNGTRVGGLVLIGLAAAVGVGIGLAPFAVPERSRDKFFVPAVLVGAVIAALGTLVGLRMHAADDAAHATVRHHDEDEEDEDEDDEDDE